MHFAVEQARAQTAYRDPLLRAWEGSKWKAALDTYMDGLTSQAKRDLALAQLQGESPAAMVRRHTLAGRAAPLRRTLLRVGGLPGRVPGLAPAGVRWSFTASICQRVR